MPIQTFKVREVTPVQPPQPGCIDNKNWMKGMTELINHLNMRLFVEQPVEAPTSPGMSTIS